MVYSETRVTLSVGEIEFEEMLYIVLVFSSTVKMNGMVDGCRNQLSGSTSVIKEIAYPQLPHKNILTPGVEFNVQT